MLSALNYELDKIKDPAKRKVAYKNWGQEDQFFISRILEMQEKGLVQAKLAPKEETLKFSGIDDKLNNDVFVVSGTLAGVPYDTRQKFHNYCPEIKMFYPTMHDPSCFGTYTTFYIYSLDSSKYLSLVFYLLLLVIFFG